MNEATKLGAYAAGLGVVFAAALAGGSAFGPPATPADSAHNEESENTMATATTDTHGSHSAGSSSAPTAGLSASAGGYTLKALTQTLEAGDAARFEFQIVGPGGDPASTFEVAHDRELHLIVVRTDLSGYQHVHPTVAPDGTWSANLDVAAGTYRVLADFQPTGSNEKLTLGTDVTVPGPTQPRPLPAPSATSVIDGYEVTLDGELATGEPSALTLTVHRDGRPVTDLQPYLAAFGHLVALRADDLAYVHVHPQVEPGDGDTQPGPQVEFHTEVPTAGAYRLYFDFRHGDRVHTAEFTVHATGVDTAHPTPSAPHSGGHAHSEDDPS